jgi:hypothetical protein
MRGFGENPYPAVLRNAVTRENADVAVFARRSACETVLLRRSVDWSSCSGADDFVVVAPSNWHEDDEIVERAGAGG